MRDELAPLQSEFEEKGMPSKEIWRRLGEQVITKVRSSSFHLTGPVQIPAMYDSGVTVNMNITKCILCRVCLAWRFVLAHRRRPRPARKEVTKEWRRECRMEGRTERRDEGRDGEWNE